MSKAEVFFATPFRLPSPEELGDRVVVLDIAFCATGPNRSYESITRPFIESLGTRLKLWVDHHDHERNEDWAEDERFVLVSRDQHPACPELITPARVQGAGPIDTIVCHHDFDGIASAARFLLGGEDPYPGCELDARAIDSRVGKASAHAERLAGALAVRHDDVMRRLVLGALVHGRESSEQAKQIDRAYESHQKRARRARELAATGERIGSVLLMDNRGHREKADRTVALLEGQKRAPVAVFLAGDGRVTVACDAALDLDLCALFETGGGMRNRVTLTIDRLDEVLRKLP
ncbi:MAG: hypothetical protein CMH55_04190 [Myxococcales bacterium]|nr:hypothetical protein [Myxococcales bacterium]|tara:strand:- start:1647 stop:2519 length:873 start_codon:yes stop_codon:yes gene_type:complete